MDTIVLWVTYTHSYTAYWEEVILVYMVVYRLLDV